MLFIRLAWADESFCAQLSSFQAIYKKQLQTIRVEHIYDGDTLRLVDGRKVRLLGVNTPELARDQRPAQALAQQAADAASQWLDQARELQLLVGAEKTDRYGRVLGHIFNDRGQNLEAFLLARGLAFAIVVPPNVQHADCFAAIESQARAKLSGVWAHEDWQPLPARLAVQQEKTGFQRLIGTVTRVDGGKTLWIELDQALVLRADTTNFPNFWVGFSSDLVGKKLVVRGWLTRRKLSNSLKSKGFKEWLMTVKSPYAFEQGDFAQ
ncbi:thermonuclease family protein [Maricurvus nonylphenolicus]|uniref:thermonuclease family protein n=1 Tax=Maricurvus nonylphenolicus TaxID=1008307 RepID=UPI0036F1F231